MNNGDEIRSSTTLMGGGENVEIFFSKLTRKCREIFEWSCCMDLYESV